MNTVKTVFLALVMLLAGAFPFRAPAQATGGTIPTVESDLTYIWGGISVWGRGRLQLGTRYPECPLGQFVTGYDETFSPTCSIPAGSPSGSIVYPAQCQAGSPPSWCSGTTADAFIRASCSQLPASGGTIDFRGLTGTLAASVPCSTPTKQVIMLQDNPSLLTITQHDGGVTFPLDNSSMLLGPGGGQCDIGGGIHLASTANVTAIVGSAHTDGSQEDFTVQGVCLWGSTSGVAGITTKGMIYAKEVFVNTTILSNNVSVCPSSCVWIENAGGIVNIGNNELNGTSGVYTFNTSPLVIASTGSAGCQDQSINIWGNNAEHANGGSNFPELSITGNGTGAQACGVYVHDIYIEKNVLGTPSTAGIKIQDCLNCKFENIEGGGGNSTSGDMINLSASAPNRVFNVTFENIGNVFNSWTNTINDTTASGKVLPLATYPSVTYYPSNPGYIEPPVMPGTTIQSLGIDVMGGAGNFATGSSNFGTNFHETGCNAFVTCTYTRTSGTPPPDTAFSQEVQITANADSSSGYNGVEYVPTTSFTAGQEYVATFWGKGDGSFTGFPTFLLWDSSTATFYCYDTTSTPFTTTWTVYSFTCTPTTSGSAHLAVTARTPVGATGTFWVGEFVFSPVTPLSPGKFVTSVGPYGISTSILGTSIGIGTGAPTSTCGTAPTGSGSLWLRTDGGASTSLYVCEGTTWVAK